MRALVYDGSLRLESERELPHPAANEALIRVHVAGICNTDLEIIRGYMGFQGVLGHEFIGTVVQTPDPAWSGARVVGEINCACGTCPTCRRGSPTHCPHRSTLGIAGRDGALADYCVLPLHNLHRVPASLCDSEAVFCEPLAAALEITEQIHIRPTEHVVVLGDGKLGLLVAHVLRLTGCSLCLVGHHESKLSLLAGQGIETCLESDAPADAGADVVVDCTGTAAGFNMARRLVRPRGRLVLKSTFQGDNQVNLTTMVVDELTLIGSRCGPFAPALRLLAQRLIDVQPLIDSVFPLDEGPAAFERAAAPNVLKVLVQMNS